MNAIYLHPVDGFTFLENVPEKPITKGWMSAGECGCYVDTKCDCMDYAKALNEAIEKRMVIGNPEVFAYKYEAGKYTKWCRVEDAHSAKSVIPWLKEGELYPWPGTWEKTYSCGDTPCNVAHTICLDGCKNTKTVVILSPLKEEKTIGIAAHVGPMAQSDKPVNSSMSEKEESEDTFSLQKAADNMRKLASLIPPKSEPVVSQDQEELPHYNIYDPKSCSEMRSELAQLRLKYFNLKLAMSNEAKCECGQNQIDYLATIEIPMCSRCGHKI